MIRVLVSAHSTVSKAGLEAVLGSSPNLQVVADDPDVIVVESDAQELLEAYPSTPLVLLADDGAAEALRSGVKGVLANGASPSQMIAAVEAAAAGLTVLQLEDIESILAAPRASRGVESLTPRESEVLGMVAEGQSNKEIAYRLRISEHTVKFHVTSIMAKLNAGSRTEAVTLGIRQGLILL